MNRLGSVACGESTEKKNAAGKKMAAEGMDERTYLFHPFCRHLLTGCVFLLRAFPARYRTQPIHLPRICGGGSSSDWTSGAGGGTATEQVAILKPVGRQGKRLRPHDHFIGAGGQHEVQAVLVIEFECGRHIQIRNLNLLGPRTAGPVVRFRVDGSTHNGVAADFFGAAIAEYENGRG